MNLKFIWDVVSQIKIGRAGQAFVVDGQGALIAHPDISLVLQKTNLSGLDQVKAALAGSGPAPRRRSTPRTISAGEQVLTAHSTIRPLGWTVFVEQPLEEAFEPLRASVMRTGLLIVLGMALSIVASLFLARRMVQPIRALQAGAERVGAGELGERIEVQTGDELEALAEQFNSMAARLQESYANLEQKVDARTRDLTEALRAADRHRPDPARDLELAHRPRSPIFDAIAESAVRLCGGAHGAALRVEDGLVHHVGAFGPSAELVAEDLAATIRGDPGRGRDRPCRAIRERRVIQVHDFETRAGRPVLDPRAGSAPRAPGARSGSPCSAATRPSAPSW